MTRAIWSLFSGIGGLELGLERAGVGEVVLQVERDEWCRRVLAKHWPNVERRDDVRDVRGQTGVFCVCGGFPCQDVSAAGRGAGLDGGRSGLWFEFRRIVEEGRPSCVVVENVASGARRWLPYVRRDLHLLGYRTRAVQVSAFDVGAPHRRERVFVLAADPGSRELRGPARPAPDADRQGELQPSGAEPGIWRWTRDGSGAWTIEPPVCGVAHGVPRRMDRLRGLGNAVVPQCAEAVGRVLMDWLTKGEET